MDCDDCMKIMCIYKGQRQFCTEKIKLNDIKKTLEKIDFEIKTEEKKRYFDFEGMK